jgi:predicted DNA-binding transcriptional regulator AlpA
MHSPLLSGLSGRELIAPIRITNAEPRNRALVYVSQSEISSLVGVDRATIFRWRKQFDDFPTGVRIGRTLRFKLLEFEAWMVAHSEGSK